MLNWQLDEMLSKVAATTCCMQQDKITSENSVNIDKHMAPLPHPISKNEKELPSVSSWT